MDRGATGFGSAWRGGCGRHGIGQGRAAVARRADRPKQIARYLRCAPPAGARGKPGQDGRSTLGPLWAGALFKEGRCMADKTVALKIGDSEKSYPVLRSEEHTSELQSLMRISYA